GFDPNITWANGSKVYALGATDVHVWKIKVLDHFSDLFKEYRAILNHDEFHKAKSFYWEEDFKSYLTGKIVLKILLSKYLSKPISEIQFNIESKKPSIISSTSLKYNLSYAGTYILISIGLCETGIDIESINPNLDYKDLLLTCFSKEEIISIN